MVSLHIVVQATLVFGLVAANPIPPRKVLGGRDKPTGPLTPAPLRSNTTPVFPGSNFNPSPLSKADAATPELDVLDVKHARQPYVVAAPKPVDLTGPEAAAVAPDGYPVAPGGYSMAPPSVISHKCYNFMSGSESDDDDDDEGESSEEDDDEESREEEEEEEYDYDEGCEKEEKEGSCGGETGVKTCTAQSYYHRRSEENSKDELQHDEEADQEAEEDARSVALSAVKKTGLFKQSFYHGPDKPNGFYLSGPLTSGMKARKYMTGIPRSSTEEYRSSKSEVKNVDPEMKAAVVKGDITKEDKSTQSENQNIEGKNPSKLADEDITLDAQTTTSSTGIGGGIIDVLLISISKGNQFLLDSLRTLFSSLMGATGVLDTEKLKAFSDTLPSFMSGPSNILGTERLGIAKDILNKLGELGNPLDENRLTAFRELMAAITPSKVFDTKILSLLSEIISSVGNSAENTIEKLTALRDALESMVGRVSNLQIPLLNDLSSAVNSLSKIEYPDFANVVRFVVNFIKGGFAKGTEIHDLFSTKDPSEGPGKKDVDGSEHMKTKNQPVTLPIVESERKVFAMPEKGPQKGNVKQNSPTMDEKDVDKGKEMGSKNGGTTAQKEPATPGKEEKQVIDWKEGHIVDKQVESPTTQGKIPEKQEESEMIGKTDDHIDQGTMITFKVEKGPGKQNTETSTSKEGNPAQETGLPTAQEKTPGKEENEMATLKKGNSVEKEMKIPSKVDTAVGKEDKVWKGGNAVGEKTKTSMKAEKIPAKEAKTPGKVDKGMNALPGDNIVERMMETPAKEEKSKPAQELNRMSSVEKEDTLKGAYGFKSEKVQPPTNDINTKRQWGEDEEEENTESKGRFTTITDMYYTATYRLHEPETPAPAPNMIEIAA